jgi:hypothetical protein
MPNQLGQEWQESQMVNAERLVQTAIASRGWTEEDLGGGPKTDPVKLEIALQLRKESTMTIPWIAQRLQMGSANTLRDRLHGMGDLFGRKPVYPLIRRNRSCRSEPERVSSPI